MIIYHVMSGIPPGDPRISIDTDLEVAKGHRPSLELQDYTILPNFKNLEVLMKTCWDENPAGRDSASKLLTSMKKPGFYGLCECLEIEDHATHRGCVAQMVHNLQILDY